MRARSIITLLCGLLVLGSLPGSADAQPDPLAAGFHEPPPEARLRCFWGWINGNVTKAAITRDLNEMQAKGFGGVVLYDSGGADQRGNAQVPAGPTFGSVPWRELYRHALAEADRLGLEVSLVIQSGWNLGGPLVTPDEAVKMATWAETQVKGPAQVDRVLPLPPSRAGYYRDVAVLSYPLNGRADRPKRRPIRLLDLKTASREAERSAPDCSMLLVDVPAIPGEEDYHSRDVVDISSHMDASGRLTWTAPAGTWAILRFGYTISGAQVSTCSESWKGLAIDHLDPLTLRSYWHKVVDPLIADAGPLAGRTLKYFMTDSWEIGGSNWTPRFREEFRSRRGYDLLTYLPVVAGRIADSRNVSNRFLNDFRKTVGDCIAENHYVLMREMARHHGIGVHPESGGPHGAPIDSLRLMGLCDIPMSEFWARATTHRTRDVDRFFVKQPASAAHTYGKRLVAAEGFTVLGPHWEETLWDNLKPSFDQAACEGLNRLVWCSVCCSPAEMGIPGQEFFAGAHFNPNVTWWRQSAPFLKYLNRCQHLLQAGLFVADACHYYGDTVPNFAQLKASDPAHVLPGYDYDVATEEVLLTRMTVKDGRIVLPDGMSYRVLVLPDRKLMPVAVTRKLKELVEAGATVVGPRPEHDSGLRDYPECDEQVRLAASELWGDVNGQSVHERRVGKGRIVWGKTAREVLFRDAVAPDFEFAADHYNISLDYIHRRDRDAEIYFVCNRLGREESLDCLFRVRGKQPELWDPISGEIRPAKAFTQHGGRTKIPLDFAPYGSLFVVFRKPIPVTHDGTAARNFPVFTKRSQLSGPWQVRFDPKWGGPASVTFPTLIDWTARPESGIQHYSGTATYLKTFDTPESLDGSSHKTVYLDLGSVKELAAVRLNGRDLGVLWSKPFRVDISGLLKPSGNTLEVEVTNFWPNRLIGDASLDASKRFTKTNIRKFKPDSPLRSSGLLGPVTLAETASPSAKILTGASYFAGWWRPTPNKWQDARGEDWRKRYPERVPILGEYNEQATMDQEILAASRAGLNYFAMLWYPVDPTQEPEPGARFLNEGLACFLKSPEAHRMKFFIEYCNHPPFEIKSEEQWARDVSTWIQAMRHPSYLKVGGRAVFKVHAGWPFVEQSGGMESATQRLEDFRKAARQAGVGELLIGGGVGSAEPIPAGHWAPGLYQFTSCYMDVPPLPQKPEDYPFQILAKWTWTAREKHLADAIPYVPYLPTGWNPRPWPDRRARFCLPTAEEWTHELQRIKQLIQRSKKFGFPLPDGQVQKAFTIYAWNEFGEGGFLAPTRGEGDQRLKAISEVFSQR